MRILTVLLQIVLVIGLIGCEDCPPPPLDAAHTLISWDIAQVEDDSLNSAVERGGNINLGPNNSATNWKDGDPTSVATKTFDCGSTGSNCNITFAVQAPPQQRDGESMTVEFEYTTNSGRQTRRINFKRQAGAGENPVHISLPKCGQITVTVSASGGNTPNIQSFFSAGPFHFECADCAIEERGGSGT